MTDDNVLPTDALLSDVRPTDVEPTDVLVAEALAPDAMTVEVIRSTRRKKSSQARLVDNRLEVRIPSWFSDKEESETVEHFVKKFKRRHTSATVDLQKRAASLCQTYGYAQPSTVEWVTNQRHRWGSCTPAHGSIRLSDRLATYPTWVVDYVLCHELAHLTEPGHGQAFWALVNQYPYTERARGFLIAKGIEGD